uniref:UTP--glucose-1-phosphate uridylyltransferase n=1 Tax=Aplanochytrium stocchinoi TaxID=215587 RepID=A0A7S3LNN5_9STRA|mmetsp:Transcript_13276/g.17206  ORF Transcript_13276/g.17206 Transcript_13276/m.17206 type:complete len:517 (-) Transcript_13276:647-2197(-)|eukprot:CAMPEP_0204840104 /NCGR_PEP_ID=MMETSP1346-20131115/36438_1 /ASSEMBLY_ACC=CAM_ASM_000771 /TAXON_ID=215587 /ORGANISM="Aplanochytrium stocchinoi, Strain GSBS06" /LENGTH=516 /DNA_ID=CAMNT_0051977299 /DNA_START=409 /DNA_END=1959 /DNA_ORIENTATION=+
MGFGSDQGLNDNHRLSYENAIRSFASSDRASAAPMDENNAREFLRYVNKFSKKSKQRCGVIDLDKIQPIVETEVDQEKENEENLAYVCTYYNNIPHCPDDMNLTHELLNKIAVLKLNGGLGTTMGCRGPKSAIEVRDKLTFLDLTVKQVEFLNTKYGVDVPLILMNSFNTDTETERVLSKYSDHNLKIFTFTQHYFPRIDKHTMTPLPTGPFSKENAHQWYPPGHGNVYQSLVDSGLVEKLLGQGKEYIFISNIDNLGATVDLNILYEIMCNDREMCMEVTRRERQDVAGGSLFEYLGKPKLLEQRSMPPKEWEKLKRLASSSPFGTMFNTNNLWISLRALNRLALENKLLLDVLFREKEITDNTGVATMTLQLETAAGAAIEFFDNSFIVFVPRKRFLPVKTTDDLFAVQSDLFTVRHGSLSLRQERKNMIAVPTVKLGANFRSVDEYLKRLRYGVPDILELEHLTVSGNVHFGEDVALKGTVIIVAEEGSRIDIASGSVLKDNVVTGNLRILEH